MHHAPRRRLVDLKQTTYVGVVELRHDHDLIAQLIRLTQSKKKINQRK